MDTLEDFDSFDIFCPMKCHSTQYKGETSFTWLDDELIKEHPITKGVEP